ncbi:MAG: hypothetical protein Q7R79_04785 [bacterium]|nr:hypothetical protein [bacterium]
MRHTHNALFLLRVGLATVFIYAGTAGFLQPLNWIGYFPHFLREVISETVLLNSFSIYELVLGAWLLTGHRLISASVMASLTFLGIIIANTHLMDIVFRDIALFFSSIALGIIAYEEGNNGKEEGEQ